MRCARGLGQVKTPQTRSGARSHRRANGLHKRGDELHKSGVRLHKRGVETPQTRSKTPQTRCRVLRCTEWREGGGREAAQTRSLTGGRGGPTEAESLTNARDKRRASQTRGTRGLPHKREEGLHKRGARPHKREGRLHKSGVAPHKREEGLHKSGAGLTDASQTPQTRSKWLRFGILCC